MTDRIAKWLGMDVRELAGATMAGEIPLRASLLNRLLADYLARKRSQVTAAVIEPHDGDRFTVHVRLRSALVPPLPVELQIVGQPDLPASPVLVLRWSLPGGVGVLARLAASPALALFDILPRGVRVDGDLIGLDVAEILRDTKVNWLLPCLKQLRLASRAGALMLKLEVGL